MCSKRKTDGSYGQMPSKLEQIHDNECSFRRQPTVQEQVECSVAELQRLTCWKFSPQSACDCEFLIVVAYRITSAWIGCERHPHEKESRSFNFFRYRENRVERTSRAKKYRWVDRRRLRSFVRTHQHRTMWTTLPFVVPHTPKVWCDKRRKLGEKSSVHRQKSEEEFSLCWIPYSFDWTPFLRDNFLFQNITF